MHHAEIFVCAYVLRQYEYIARILSLHGISKTIVLDHGPQFVSKVWE
jgi:hypothetical protein